MQGSRDDDPIRRIAVNTTKARGSDRDRAVDGDLTNARLHEVVAQLLRRQDASKPASSDERCDLPEGECRYRHRVLGEGPIDATTGTKPELAPGGDHPDDDVRIE